MVVQVLDKGNITAKNQGKTHLQPHDKPIYRQFRVCGCVANTLTYDLKELKGFQDIKSSY